MKQVKRKVNKVAKTVAKAAGAKDLVSYAGSKIAKARAPKSTKKYVEDTTTAKAARKSGIKLAANIASLAAGGAALGTARKMNKARKLATTARKKQSQVHSNAYLKRTYSGHEAAARKAAAKRAKRRK